MSKLSLKDLGTKIGHFTDEKGKTGCTVLLFDSRSVCGVHTAGGAPGTRETDSLKPSTIIDGINGLLLTGGSAFGLAAADGVMDFLANRKIGFPVGDDIIPIVPAAVIYDRSVGSKTAPTSNDGNEACKSASYESEESGKIGAGTGATVGKWSKEHKPDDGGFSIVINKYGDITVCALVIVNAYGNIIGDNGEIIAGATDDKGAKIPYNKKDSAEKPMGNTTIGAIITDAHLTKSDATSVATTAHYGITKTIKPSHTIYDGDTLFALSTGTKLADPDDISAWAGETLAQAIIKAVSK